MAEFEVTYKNNIINPIPLSTQLEGGINKLSVRNIGDQIDDVVYLLPVSTDTVLLSKDGVIYTEYITLNNMASSESIDVYAKILKQTGVNVSIGSFDLKIIIGGYITEMTYDTLYDYCRTVGISDNEFVSPIIHDIQFAAEIYHFWDDVEYNTSPTLGTNENDTRMLILIYHGNLTINKDVTISPLARKRGMTIYVEGTLINNGNISMTARGAVAIGQDIYLYKSNNGTYEYIPANGMNGGNGVITYGTTFYYGYNGANGISRKTGGGGAGGARSGSGATNRYGTGGNGAYGTSYSGGAAGGAGIATYEYTHPKGENGADNGGKGGKGIALDNLSWVGAGGGAGNPGGVGFGPYGTVGATGTGGTLILYANTIINTGGMYADGSNGGSLGGGGSGGGSINVFYKETYTSTGIIQANGGSSQGGTAPVTDRQSKGGNGCITVMQIT